MKASCLINRTVLIILFLSFLILQIIPVSASTPGDDFNNPAMNDQTKTQTMGQKLKATGLTGLALLAISIFSLSYALERFINIRRHKIVPLGLTSTVQKLWSEGKYDEIDNECEKNKSTLGRVIQTLTKHRDLKNGEISTLASDISSRELKLHLHRAYPLAVAATISPLLGLFGTVYGMIGAFDAVAQAHEMGDPSIMAESISFALMTTAIGLVIAVPSLAAYHYFRTRINIFALILEEEVNELILNLFMKKE
ncbi:MotA/TolQ/ExbB proton channel family protein [candidate division KSB1 bacterium]|nr:MotA/TolQ/ExbB proton channel family protein [candidate division KSB1 bacterium]